MLKRRGRKLADNNSDYKGYRGDALDTLKKYNALVWSNVDIKTSDGTYSGTILPRSETADALHIVLKIPVGYNLGIAAKKVTGITVHSRKEAHYKIPEK